MYVKNRFGILRFILVAGLLVGSFGAEAGPLTEKIAAKYRVTGRDGWQCCDRTVFDFEGYEAWVVEPPAGTKVAEGRPWTWTMQWATAYVPRTSVPRLVKERGWHHATVITFKDKMDAHGLEVSKRFQDFLVNDLGLAPKVNLIGMSWGGFFSTRYAATYPDQVASIYLDCPLMFLRVKGPVGPWTTCEAPDFDWPKDSRMPINLVDKVAAAKIPVLLLYGGQDATLDPKLHAEAFISKFQSSGGNLKFVKRPMYGHHPHGVEIDENTIIDFFVRNADAEKAAKDELAAALARLRASVRGGEIKSVLVTNGNVAVDFTLRTSPVSAVNCHLVLPPPAKWDGRFWGIGNQGRGDDFRWWLVEGWQMPRVKAGSAACLADMGTAGGRFGAETLRDFGWRAMHQMTVEAKALVAEFYGRAAGHNYFLGISSGGGQGIHEAERFPEDYEGIIAYVPANNRTDHMRMSRHNYFQIYGADGKQVITKDQCKAVAEAAVAQFGGSYVPTAEYDEKTADAILARAAKKVPTLADGDLQRRWKALWKGPEHAGRTVPDGVVFGADISEVLDRKSFMLNIHSGPKAKPVWEYSDEEFEKILAEMAPEVDASSGDLSTYLGRNAKLMIVSGLSDSIVSARSALAYCRRAAKKAKGADWFTRNFRAYFLPGREHGARAAHCDGVNNIPAVPLLIDWCEKGKDPGIVSAPLRNGTKCAIAPWAEDK